jgi:hypothetical protein
VQIFTRGATDYEAQPLSQVMGIEATGELLAALPPSGAAAAVVAWLVAQRQANGQKRAFLLGIGDQVLLNGQAPLAMMALRRGDEIRVAGKSLFFTDEDPLRVIHYDGLAGPGVQTSCSRCHRLFSAGEPVVACPVCGLLYMHQADREETCWSFGPCLGCQRDPHVQFVWRPEKPSTSLPWRQRPGRAPQPAGVP